MVFPWVGLFEQLRLADTFVHYVDVQLPMGRSFMTRVQVKTAAGPRWLSVPVLRRGRTLIRDVRLDTSQDWRRKHLSTLQHAYGRAPFFEDMLGLVERVYRLNTDYLWELNAAGVEEISSYFGFAPRFLVSSDLGANGAATERLLDIARLVGARRYVTGHGALDYLDHGRFESAGIRCEYVDYMKAPYPQLHGAFTPFVSILDCIANCGHAGQQVIQSRPVYWKEFVSRERG